TGNSLEVAADTYRDRPKRLGFEWRSALEQGAGHDDPLDLVGALVDLGDLGVAHHALDREVGGVTGAAEELDGVGGDFHGHIGGKALGGGGDEAEVLLAALGAGRGGVD